VPEYRVVFCLAGADGLGVGELAAMAIMTQPRMTKVLDRMERQGLVGRHADAGDRRRVLIHLTPAGRKRAAPVLRAAKAHEARLLAPFTAEERAVIKRALDLLINGRA
jgi:3-hydroxy-9,10-secoandrosta-1,3,5(10)-triene-9,17-dione monooxygenase reductase component